MSTDRVAGLEADIEGGPGALAALLEAYAESGGPLAGVRERPARIAFTGLGSSRFAALTAAAQLRSRGASAWTEYASTDLPTAPAADLVLVAISASGTTRETVEAAARHRGTSRVIAVTNEVGSPLAGESDVVLPLMAGTETSRISTRTFRATIAVLGMLAGSWLERDAGVAGLWPTVDALRSIVDARAGWLGEAADRLDGAAALDVLGGAGDAAMVEQAALMLREGPRLPAVAHDTADWLHTAVYLAFPGHRALVFSGSGSDATVLRTVVGRGGETILVGEHVPGASQVIPVALPVDRIGRVIVGSVVGELLAAELWRRTTAQVLPSTVEPAQDGLDAAGS